MDCLKSFTKNFQTFSVFLEHFSLYFLYLSNSVLRTERKLACDEGKRPIRFRKLGLPDRRSSEK